MNRYLYKYTIIYKYNINHISLEITSDHLIEVSEGILLVRIGGISSPMRELGVVLPGRVSERGPLPLAHLTLSYLGFLSLVAAIHAG